MSKEDEALRQLIVELRLLEGSARVVQSRLSVVEATLSEICLLYTSDAADE